MSSQISAHERASHQTPRQDDHHPDEASKETSVMELKRHIQVLDLQKEDRAH